MVAAPVAAGPPGNPFVGSWQAPVEYGEQVGTARLQIGNGGTFHVRTTIARLCEGDDGFYYPATSIGSVERISESTVQVTTDFYCHWGRDGGRQYSFTLPYEISYDAGTDTLITSLCWYRPGTDPAVCENGE